MDGLKQYQVEVKRISSVNIILLASNAWTQIAGKAANRVGLKIYPCGETNNNAFLGGLNVMPGDKPTSTAPLGITILLGTSVGAIGTYPFDWDIDRDGSLVCESWWARPDQNEAALSVAVVEVYESVR